MKNTKEKIYILIILLHVLLMYHTDVVMASGEQYPESLNAAECPVITGDMLRYYYQNGIQVRICGEGYTIWLNGNDIRNCENELHTQIDLLQTDKGIVFEVNQGKKLCGDFILEFEQYKEDKLYLYNNSKEKYELLDAKNSMGLSITQEGKYLLTEMKDVNHTVRRTVFGGGLFLLAGMVVGYIWVKKRYWFW